MNTFLRHAKYKAGKSLLYWVAGKTVQCRMACDFAYWCDVGALTYTVYLHCTSYFGADIFQ